jgi:hypothetical protein
MGAIAWVVAAKGVAQMPMTVNVIGLDTNAAALDGLCEVPPVKRSRPPAVVSFEQEVTVTGALRQRHQLPR